MAKQTRETLSGNSKSFVSIGLVFWSFLLYYEIFPVYTCIWDLFFKEVSMSFKDEIDNLHYKYPRSNCINMMPIDWERLDVICRDVGASRAKVLTLLVRRHLEVEAQREAQVEQKDVA